MAEAKRILIVGGVAGGASAAARARRLSEEARITIFERGQHISFANCGMPYHIGGTIPQRDRLLVQTAAAMKKRFDIDVQVGAEAVRIDRAGKQLIVRDLATGQEQAHPYDALILSPGAEPVRPPIPGVKSGRVFTLRGMADMDAIKAAAQREKIAGAAIIGGGYIGLEMAEALRNLGMTVTLVELAPQVFAPADPEMALPVQRELMAHGVDVRLNTSVTSFAEEGDKLVVSLSSGQSVRCGLAILAIGVRPEAALAREAGLAVGSTGGIVVDDHMRTSDPDIYAVGDAVEVTEFVSGGKATIPLAGPANRQGRIAADNIFGGNSVYRKTQGTAICKIFDLTAGVTGLNEKTLKRLGLAYEKIYVHPASHASYYPGASQMTLKLLFDPRVGRILGAQAVGAQGVDKRIDVLAVALRAGMTVMDLEELELSYAPPYGSAKDPVNYAGFVAANVLRGAVRLCHTPEMLSPQANQLLLDVRTPGEVAAGTIPGAINIPLDDLRQRMAELSRDKEILVFCQAGLRGYLACRILSQNGFACRNLTGGYKTFAATTEAAGNLPSAPVEAKREMKDDTGQGGPPAGGCTGGHCGESSPANGKSKEIDAMGLQCPGPIMRLHKEIETLKPGQTLRIQASDPGFAADVAAWCKSTGHELVDLSRSGRAIAAVIRRSAATSPAPSATPPSKGKTIVVFSNDFDKAMAAFIIANGAAAMGSEVTLFFTFWGLNILRRPDPPAVKKNLVERMFGWMMPRGAEKLSLSKMNMGGVGLAMIKGIMRKKKVAALPELIRSAKDAGVKLVACAMSMDLMGIKREEFIDGVEEGGVAMYLQNAENSGVNLFV